MTTRVLGSLLAAGLAGVSVSAHHSIAGVYDGSQRVTIEGTIAEFQFVNPHPFVMVDVADGKAPPRRWRLELDNRHELVAEGMNADTLKPGDRVLAIGSPGRTLPHTMYVRRLDRPSDGFRYEQVGSSPRVSRGRGAGG
jgi:hypothetical protein